MIKCGIDDKALKQIQSKTALVLRTYLKNKESMSTLKANMQNLLDKISQQYELTNIDDIVKTIYNMSIRYGVVDQNPDFFSTQNLSNLITAQQKGIQVNNTLETSTDNLVDAEQIRLRFDASREFLDNAYGLAKEVSDYVVNNANRNIFDCLFINRGSIDQPLGIVRNTTELNRNIRQYQEFLLKRVTNYLSQVVKNAPNLHTTKEVKQLLLSPSLYQEIDGEIRNTGILESISQLANMYLSPTNFNVDILRQLFNNMNDSTLPQSERESAKQKLEAYNAKVILDHFDTYLAITLGKAIQIKDFNQKTGEDKYQISGKTANLATTWRVSENIFVEDEADMITKLAINTTPLIKWQQSIPINDKFITFQDFEHIIAKVKDLVYREDVIGITFDNNFIEDNYNLWSSLSEDAKALLNGKRLDTVINMIRRNPRQYLHSIFELLTNKDFYDLYYNTIYKDFTEDEINKLYSISRGIFNGSNSIYELAGQSMENDYYSYITQTADAIFNVNYLQYYKDQDGVIQVRTLIDQSVNNIRRSLEQTIDTSNSRRLIKDFNQYKQKLRLTPNSYEDFKSISFTIPNTNVRVGVVASSGSVSFYDNSTNQQINNFVQLWRDDNIKQFIDNILHLNITQDTGFQEALYNIEKEWSILCKDLLSFASRVILNQYVSNDILKDKSMSEKESLITSIYGRNAPRYNYTLDELGLVHGNDIRLLKNISIAKANLQGITTASQVKDGTGNSQSMYTLSRLLGSLQSQFEMQERQPWSATKDLMLLNIPGLYEGVYTAKEFYDQTGNNKESTAMGVSEMAYAGIVHDFIKGFIYQQDSQDLVGNGHMLFLPSVNSDKGTIGRIRVNLNKTVNINGQLKAIKDLDSNELEWIISKEFGTLYTNIYTAITNDWQVLDNYLREQNINAPSLAQDFVNGFENFNKYFSDHFTELAQYGSNPANFIKHFVLQYNSTHRLHPLEIIDQVHYKSNKGNLGINETILAQIARFNPQFISKIKPELLQKYPTSRQFWTIKKAEVLKTLIKSDFNINTSNVNQPELKYLRDTFSTWINSSGNLILAKATINGRLVNITSARDIIRISENNVNDVIDSIADTLILNPMIEQYNYLDYLFTQEFMDSTVGSFIAHPPKGKINNVLEQEAAQFQAQHKRNVSFTAAMHPFQLNLLNGIPEWYNVAVIDDIKDEQGTITGLLNDIKPFDGATFVNPFVVILENNSLGGARAGITKKQFVHFKNERTGTGGIIKTAGFGLTNDWIRNSPFLAKMMQKMTDHVWLNQNGTPAIVDITRDFRGNQISYKDFFFRQGDRLYQIVGINSLGNNTYSRQIQQVTIDGNPDGPIVQEEPVLVNTNYKLWNFFGGAHSMTMEGRFLKLSNTSVENVVTAMNNIGSIIGNPSKIETQDQLWQPLKQVDVHYVATAGAVKQGAANINSASKYYDNTPYDTQRIRMYQAGIQLDKEHHADDSELSLMTQVISACAAKGYTLEAAIGLYDALRKSTEIGTKDHLQAVKNLFTNGTEQSMDQFQEVLMKSIIDSLGTGQKISNNFAEIIASDLIKQAKEGKKIKFSEALLPLSDNTVYAKIFSIISSYLTNAGIKQKIPGILSVLTPSHEIFKLYAGRKYESFTNPEQELEELQNQQVPVYEGLYQYSPDMQEFAGMKIIYVQENSLISPIDNQPVAARNPHDGTILIDEELLKQKFKEKAWEKIRNSKPLDRDFKSYDEWKKFVLLHEAMHNIYPRLEHESKFDYETRINEQALKRFDNNISNLELGRTYLVTREYDEEIQDENGNTRQVPRVDEIPQLIRTPQEYRELKEQIQHGIVTRVVEDVRVGRNLAGYNVRFSSNTGDRFQLWDLDSASALFELNELKENWRGSNQDIQNLQSLYQKLFGVFPNMSNEDTQKYLYSLEIRARRMLQNDLENLSHSSSDIKEQYQKLISTKQDTRQWYNRYAQWVNIKLGRGHGSKLYLRGSYVQVDSSNFDEIQNIISNILDTTTKVRINGIYHTIDKSSITTQAYEIIMPKTFATAFGLKEFDDLEAIKGDPDFFVKQYLQNQATKVNNNQYTIELKTSSGAHYYLLTKKQAINSGLTKINPLVVTIDGKTYRLDSNQNIMYEISLDTEIYQDNLGNEVIVTDDLDFYINNLQYDSIKLSDRLINYPSLVRNISDTLKNSSNKVAKSYHKYVTSQGSYPPSIMAMNTEYHSVTLENYHSVSPTNPIIKQGRDKHTSFLKSLDIVAARIPAQSMQSYMPMKVVAYDNPNINTAYVSTYQILLQGSDYDIDAVSLATYDINNNGILQLWSPYSNIDNLDLMDASMQLPIPSGVETQIQEADDITNPISFLDKYKDILDITESILYNKQTKEYEADPNEINIDLKLNTVEKIILFKQFLEDIKSLTKPSMNQLQRFAYALMKNNQVNFTFRNPNQVLSIFDKLQNIVNNHNLYFDKLSRYNLSKIVNNYTMYSMYRTIADPVNLIQAQTSVDGTTGPLKSVANQSLEGKEAKFRTPGNAFNKFQSIVENQVGKQGIGICAVGLKGFFGLTQYNNYLLNYGTSEQQERLLLGSDHRGYILGGKVYKLLSNIRSKDPNSITNDDVLEALASVTNDNDAALVLSALLSLATDNAKELALSKLNAGTKTIGMYIYGISIGMDFRDVAKILMSDVGSIITTLLDNDVFSGRDGYSRVKYVFDYFDKGPTRLLNKFDIGRDMNGDIIASPLKHFERSFAREIQESKGKDGKQLPLAIALSKFARSNADLAYKLNTIEKFRQYYGGQSTYANEVYNQLVDFVEDYIRQAHVIGQHEDIYYDIQTLSDGAEEMRSLGAILSLNQGIKTNPEGLLNQVNLIERAIYDKTGDLDDLVDLTKFVFDEKYRLDCIQRYEKVKHSFNIYDVVSTIPHFMGYLQTLAIALREVSGAFKFRSTKALVLDLSEQLDYEREDKITKGVQNFVGDYLRKQWMQSNNLQIIIPKGNKAFDKFGNIVELTEDTYIKLGTDWGDATFRVFMENEIIPNLKKGVIKTNSDIDFVDISHNRFIQDLCNDLLTNTVSRNPSVIYTLPINMLPRQDQERAIFNAYKAEFNKLAKYSYQYQVSSYDKDGNLQTYEAKIPLIDLFTYYAMIADGWKLGEKSLVPILEDFQKSGVINDFHEFESMVDKSEEYLSLQSIDKNDLLPYVAPFESPYSSHSEYIQYRNPQSRKYQLMRKLSNTELEIEGDENIQIHDPNIIKNYKFQKSDIDINYFPTGMIESSIRTVKHQYEDNGQTNYLDIQYDIDSGMIQEIILNGNKLSIPELTFIPTIKFNGIKKIDMSLLESIIKSKTNPC